MSDRERRAASALRRDWIHGLALLGVEAAEPVFLGGNEPVRVPPRDDLSPKRLAEESGKRRKTFLDGLASLLGEKRFARLKQLARQRETLDGLERFFFPVIAEAGTTPDQRENLYAMLIVDFPRAAIPLLRPGKDREEILRAVDALEQDYLRKAEAVLDAGQRKKLQAILGEPFKGRLDGRDDADGPENYSKDDIRRMSVSRFGRWRLDDLRRLRRPSLREEFKLDAKQADHIDAAIRELHADFGSDLGTPEQQEERCKAAHAEVGKRMAAILTAAQRKRYLEVTIQERLEHRHGFVRLPAAGLPGVAEALGLDAKQKERFAEEDGILTEAQEKKLAELAGVKSKAIPADRAVEFDWPLPAPHSFLEGLGIDRYSTRLIDVEKALKLTEEQADELETVLAAFRKTTRELRASRGLDFNEKMEAATMAFTEGADKILDPAQRKRLGEAALQKDAAESLGRALARFAALDLTEEQKKRLLALEEEGALLQEALRPRFMRGVGPRLLFRAIRDRADAAQLEVLDDKQRKAWKEALGEPLPGLR